MEIDRWGARSVVYFKRRKDMSKNRYEDFFQRVRKIAKSECPIRQRWDVFRYPGCRVRIDVLKKNLSTEQWIIFSTAEMESNDDYIKDRMSKLN